MDVLEKIKKMQEERGWSTYKLSLESGITQSTLSNMFSRGTCPTIETLELICEAFNISICEFFSDGEKTTYLSNNERDFIKKYRALPEHEKNAIFALVNNLISKK